MNTNLRVLRRARNITQVQLRDATGIDQALISKFKSGERVPPTEALVILADYFDVSIDYILGRTDKPEVNR